MLDPASTGSMENISLGALVGATRTFEPMLAIQLEAHLERGTRAVGPVVKHLRNKFIAHADKTSAFTGEAPKVEPASVAIFIEEAKALLLKVNAGVFDVGWFDHRPGPHNAVEDLVRHLKWGRQKRWDDYRAAIAREDPRLAALLPENEDDF